MAYCTKELLSGQVRSECQELESAGGLPFRELLSGERILAALERAGVEFRDRIYTPMVTLWAFLSQVVASKDSSCQHAVGEWILGLHRQPRPTPRRHYGQYHV